jgi:hypothetical protein
VAHRRTGGPPEAPTCKTDVPTCLAKGIAITEKGKVRKGKRKGKVSERERCQEPLLPVARCKVLGPLHGVVSNPIGWAFRSPCDLLRPKNSRRRGSGSSGQRRVGRNARLAPVAEKACPRGQFSPRIVNPARAPPTTRRAISPLPKAGDGIAGPRASPIRAHRRSSLASSGGAETDSTASTISNLSHPPRQLRRSGPRQTFLEPSSPFSTAQIRAPLGSKESPK